MEKLIINCACMNWRFDDKNIKIPRTLREVVDSACDAANAGAAIVHVHPPQTKKHKGGRPTTSAGVEAWMEVTHQIRQRSNALLEFGSGGFPFIRCKHHIPQISKELEDKSEVLSNALATEKPDLMPVGLGTLHLPDQPLVHSSAPASDNGVYFMATREELKSSANICRKFDMKPTFNASYPSTYFNLQWLADNKLIDPPYWCFVEVGREGRGWCPATIEEMMYRFELLPKGSKPYVCILCSAPCGIATTQQQLTLQTWAIATGAHLRCGIEDNPYYWDGVPAESNARIVERIVRLARELGREVASPAEARQILGMPPRKKNSQ